MRPYLVVVNGLRDYRPDLNDELLMRQLKKDMKAKRAAARRAWLGRFLAAFGLFRFAR